MQYFSQLWRILLCTFKLLLYIKGNYVKYRKIPTCFGNGFFFYDYICCSQEEESDVEEVVVTGSRIATSEFTGAQPVVVLDKRS